ncbi:pyrroloquinoline quinone biosynthesis peptide chaperone PqqD [Grimontia hollisae]|uniref:Coenzyme PQQ synthesis protein D n=1 Tax=Grimontia hollisae CIP 101886 TaxID=675812 RepID=D0I8M4_GRIHO|nr:pyrroloquinoline quinone biosynthesis peptide chaperone PqqD [Grimontia hollisae]AMG30905.1 pyrroloquinoline quinone biosynthesis peptide chaperone PqqD [Grimontia hollisae]EEY72993.1 coenzyme PQQ synthesis protein D [Grimontia hollisae CIP 101886]MDF2183229.1 pyrroloquinoline quinone biosynthesis peptide chaperone PqqD [Grimontia hollisae]STO47143.1 pyrroloquinoline quinone biosynthesis protein PqqD [Grimontia hollisae]STQ77108.1 pyrroloquinoline quinone biosynthesis protein PqqD [Grimonti
MNSDTVYQRNSMFRMQFEKAQDCHVLLYPEGMVKLSESAAEILMQFDMPSSVTAAIARLEEKFPGVDLAGDVNEFVEVACDKKWLETC